MELFLFLAGVVLSNVFYVLTWRSDPGYIDVSFTKPMTKAGIQSSHPDEIVIEMNQDHADVSETKSLLSRNPVRLRELESMPAVAEPPSTSSNSSERGVLPPDYCVHCDMTQAPRSKHCRQCDRCVARFDHHCPHMGNCVGGNNHVYFWWYLITQAFMMGWATQSSWQMFEFLVDDYGPVLYCAKLLTLFISGIGFLTSFSLCCFHAWLICNNMTTFEMLKMQRIRRHHRLQRRDARTSSSRRNPKRAYDQGIVRNILEACVYKLNRELTTATRHIRHHSTAPDEVEIDTFEDALPDDI